MKKILKFTLFALAGFLAVIIFNQIFKQKDSVSTGHRKEGEIFENGDIIFQISKSSQSKAVQAATHSKYSHMGIIFVENNKTYVFEAIQTVKLTPVNEWIKRGEDEHFVLKRLKDSKSTLTADALSKMKMVGNRFKGKDYDIYFEWSDNKIYCSELVWKIYKEALNIEIGKLQTLKDFDLSNKLVKQKIQERYGNHIPLDENVISPASMFDSKKLETVFEN